MPVTLGDRYRLDTLIGGGGMGEVWRAYDEVLNREVAVKVIRDHLAEDLTIRERLRTEAQLAGSLHHPGIVDVYDYGEHQEEDGRTTPFLVMPLVDGVSLSAMLKARVALPVGESMAIVAEMAGALEAAHAAGIVHRDLKPANVMLTSSGRVMILDFGIARSTEGDSLTQTGALIGTADYLSPEQASGRQATYASDLYALGIVAYTCLTGIPPFHRETDIATALAHVQAPMPDLPDELLAAGVGPLITSLLAKEPTERPSAAEVASSASELATTAPTEVGTVTDPESTQPGLAPTTGLAATLAAAPAAATLAAAPVAPTQSGMVPTGVAETTAEVVTEERRGSRRTVLASAAVLAIVAVVLAFLYQGRGDVEVPDVRKMTSVDAASTLAKVGLKVKTHEVDAAGYEAGQVVDQSPEAGANVDEGSTVDLGVATGLVPIPDDLVGTSYEDAAEALQKLGLKPQRSDQASEEKAGTVTAVDPDTRAKPGQTVVLTVARGSDDDGNAKDDKKDKGKKDKGKVEPSEPAAPEPTQPEPTETASPAAG